jgi:hypothetical protein
MTSSPETAQRDARIPVRSNKVVEAHERMLRASTVRSRFIETRSGGSVHVLEAGEGPPVLHLHGTNTSALSLLPVLERLDALSAIAVDRPGFGLSEPVQIPRERFREAAVQFVDEIADVLGFDTFAIAGNSWADSCCSGPLRSYPALGLRFRCARWPHR